MNVNGVNKDYIKGDSMLWRITPEPKSLKRMYLLELIEVKQTDCEILFQLVNDLKKENKYLKKEIERLKSRSPIVGTWNSTGQTTQDGNIM